MNELHISFKRVLLSIPLILIAVTPLESAPISIHRPGIQAGEVIPMVRCAANPRHSYALFIPEKSLSLEDAPVLFILDPAARGEFALRRFYTVADKWGVILAASNSSRNGPAVHIAEAITSMWRDFRVIAGGEPRIVFVAGFSGGARAATFFSKVVGRRVTGIIACGAGMSPTVKLPGLETRFYCGIAGYADFNYREMRLLDMLMDKVNLPHHFIHGHFGHRWPPTLICLRALEWLIYRTVLAGEDAVPDFSTANFLRRELDMIRCAENDGDLLKVSREASSLVKDVPDSSTRSQLSRMLTKTLSSPRYKAMKRSENHRHKRELRVHSRTINEFDRLDKRDESDSPDPAMIRRLGITNLKRNAEKDGGDSMEQAFSLRLLHFIGSEASSRALNHHLKNHRPELALQYYDILVACGNPVYLQPLAHYNSACILSLRGEMVAALKRLNMALEAGFRNFDLLGRDPDLIRLRYLLEFSGWLPIRKERFSPGQ